MFDFNYSQKRLRVVRTLDLKVILEVPEDLLQIKEGENLSETVREVFAKVYFNRNDTINIMNDK